MASYADSDYARNKDSEGIVYRFNHGETVTVTKESYLASNPSRTEEDFLRLKAASDSIFHEEDLADGHKRKKTMSIHGMEDTHAFSSITIDEAYLVAEDKKRAMNALASLLSSGALTEIQKRRFLMHVVDGLSLREIADRESVHFTSVNESIIAAISKLRKFFWR